MLKLLLVILIICLNPGIGITKELPNDEANSATIELTGQVIDGQTNEGLSGVAVKLDGFNEIAYTDFDGNYRFDNLYPGKYDISISYPTYQDKKLTKIKVRGGEKKSLTIELSNIQ